MNLKIGPNIKVHDIITILEPLSQLLEYKKSQYIDDNEVIIVEGVEIVPQISRIYISIEGEEAEEKYIESILQGVYLQIYITIKGGEEVATLLDIGAEYNYIS